MIGAKGQISEGTTAESVAASAKQNDESFPRLGTVNEEDELVEKEIRARFKRMCEGYFDSVSRKLVIEHKVCLALFHFSTSNRDHVPITASTRARSKEP